MLCVCVCVLVCVDVCVLVMGLVALKVRLVVFSWNQFYLPRNARIYKRYKLMAKRELKVESWNLGS